MMQVLPWTVIRRFSEVNVHRDWMACCGRGLIGASNSLQIERLELTELMRVGSTLPLKQKVE